MAINSLQLLKIFSVGILLFSSVTFAGNHRIFMKSLSFEPKLLEIKLGDSVEWENASYTEHSATAYIDDNKVVKFDTGLIQPKKNSKKIEFKDVGTFSYHCSVHGKMMSGKITVTK